MQSIPSAISPNGIHASNIALPWDTAMPDPTKVLEASFPSEILGIRKIVHVDMDAFYASRGATRRSVIEG